MLFWKETDGLSHVVLTFPLRFFVYVECPSVQSPSTRLHIQSEAAWRVFSEFFAHFGW